MALTPEQTSAKGILQAALAEFGLESLTEWAWGLRNEGMPLEQLFGIELRKRPEYKARFPALDALAQKGRAVSEAEYIGIERGYAEVLQQGGVPSGFYDEPSDFQAWLEGEVSPAELGERVLNQWVRVANTAPEIRDYFEDEFGVDGDSALLAVYLDPQRALPALEKMTATAEFGGIGRTLGLDIAGTLSRRAADLGVSGAQAREGLGNVAGVTPLFRETISEGEDLRAEQEGVEAAFNLNTTSAKKVERRREEREALAAGSPQGGARDAGIGLGASEQRRRR